MTVNSALFKDDIFEITIPFNIFGSISEDDINASVPLFILHSIASFHGIAHQDRIINTFEIDESSVEPHLVQRKNSCIIEEYSEEVNVEEFIEYNYILRMPPIKQYSITIDEMTVRKAEPNFYESDWV
jgi:hypothetical protein